MEKQNKTKTPKTKCQKCGYEWITKSQMVYVSCPSCRIKTPIKTL